MKMKKVLLSLLLVFIFVNTFQMSDTMAAIASDNIVEVPSFDSPEYDAWKQRYVNQNKTSLSNNRITAYATNVSGNKVYNDFVEFAVSASGRYTIGTTGGDPNNSYDDYKKLLYGHPSSNTSYTTVNIDGNIYIFEPQTINFLDGNDEIKTEAIQNIDDVEIKQILRIVKGTSSQREDTVEIKYEVKNHAPMPCYVGIRIMMDTMLGSNDYAPFRVPGIGAVTKELEISGDDIPEFWQAFDSLTNPTVISQGTLIGNQFNKPDKIQFANWSRMYNSEWGYTVNPDYSIGDSAVGIVWEPKVILQENSREYITHYGLSELQQDLRPPLAVSVSGASNIQFSESGYIPNPFTVTAYIMNTGNGNSINTKAKLILPEGLKLVSGQQQEIDLGTIAPSAQERQVSWQVEIEYTPLDKTLTYLVVVSSDNADTKTIARNIFIPAAILVPSRDINNPTVIAEGTVGAVIQNKGEMHYYSFTPQETAVYVFESQGNTDVYGELFNDKKLFINGHDDKSATNTNFGIYQRLTKGKEVFIRVGYKNNDGTGAYGLKISKWEEAGKTSYMDKLPDTNEMDIPTGNKVKQTILRSNMSNSKEVISDMEITQDETEHWYKIKLNNKRESLIIIMNNYGIVGIDLDLELYKKINNEKIKLVTYDCSYPTQPAYFDKVIYEMADENSEYYVRVRYNADKPGLSGGYVRKLLTDYQHKYEMRVFFESLDEISREGSEYEGWKKFFDSDSLINENSYKVLGFDPVLRKRNGEAVKDDDENEIKKEYFDENIKFTDLLKKAISVVNDARWRHNFTESNDLIKNDYIYAFNEFNIDLDEFGITNVYTFMIIEDENWTALLNSAFEINSKYFTLEELSRRLTLLKPQPKTDKFTVETLAVRTLVHECLHRVGLADVYASKAIYPEANIDNTTNVMSGVTIHWNVEKVDKYNYSTYLDPRDMKGLLIVNNVWGSTQGNNLQNSYMGLEEEEMYKNSHMIVKGKVKEILQDEKDDNLNKVFVEVEEYYKDLSRLHKKDIVIFQYKDDENMLEENSEYILYLNQTSDGNLVILGGPQGIYSIYKNLEKVESHWAKLVRTNIENERKYLNSILDADLVTEIEPYTFIDEFEKVIKKGIEEYAPDNADTGGIPVKYYFGGFLSPIKSDGSGVFKLGSTIPVKFQLKDSMGNFVADAKATLSFEKVTNGISGNIMDAVSSGKANTGNLFRYDSKDNQYIFNLSTKSGFSIGVYNLIVSLDDGSSYSIQISLR